MGIRDLQKALDGFESKPESRGYDLRLNLSEIVLRHLKEKGWSQKDLATEAGMKEAMLSRIIHANANCTFDVAGRLLFALGVDAALQEAPSPTLSTSIEFYTATRVTDDIVFRQGTGYGKDKEEWLTEIRTSSGDGYEAGAA